MIVQIFLSFRTVLNCITNRIQLRIAKLRNQKPFTCLFQDSFIVSPLQRHIFFPSVCVSSPACPFLLLYFPFSLLFVRLGATEASARPTRCMHQLSTYLSYLPTTYLSANLSTFDRVELYAPYAQAMYELQQQQQHILPIYLLLLVLIVTSNTYCVCTHCICTTVKLSNFLCL